jgi:exopolyphosphatase/guanosine-5'-triphosphate,3'-diphosphate pyrophosphatase
MVVIETKNCRHQEPAFIRFLDDHTSRDVALEASKDAAGNISKAGIEQLLSALKALKTQAIAIAHMQSPESKTIEFGAVGTHALRTANNQGAVITAVSKLGIPLLAITQKEEAALGVSGTVLRALQRPECKDKTVIVWDVGGGSQQWSVNSRTHPLAAGLPIGAEAFKLKLIAAFKPSAAKSATTKPEGAKPICEIKGPTPNPIGHEHIPKALELAAAEAKALPKELTSLKFDQFCVFGIGGVHNKAIREHIAHKWRDISTCACQNNEDCKLTEKGYNRRELDCLAEKFSDETDCDSDIKGPYSTTNASNLLLISGFMHALNIERIYTENVTMGHGLAQDAGKLKSHFRKQKL